MSSFPKYHLVHIITSNEYKTPLLETQIFDRAQFEATIPGDNKPLSVSVWIIEPMRDVFNKQSRNHVRNLRKRSPDVKVNFIGGIGRLQDWPALSLLKLHRSALGKEPVVYHCRGESSFHWARKVQHSFSQDKIVSDIRGYMPLERLAAKNIFKIDGLSKEDADQYQKDIDNLKNVISLSDNITTVSKPFRNYLVKNLDAPASTYVIPCCVSDIVSDAHRQEIRNELELQDKIAILYLGGVQKYQHLDDLVLPFIKAILNLSDKYVAVFISHQQKKIQQLVSQFELPQDRVRIISVSQNEVGKYLTAMDAGLLLRAPSVLNTFAQPVKFGEYLAAGVPVIAEEGTGEVPEILSKYNIGVSVSITNKTGTALDEEVKKVVEWLENGLGTKKLAAKKFVQEQYTWPAVLSDEREMYLEALKSKPRIKI